MDHFDLEGNENLRRLPPHLKQFIKPQNYQDYSPIDQAVWRYVMRKNVDYLARVAHHSYLEGLAKTGISIDRIPNMYGMNRILKEIGWAAVAVDGFIPPNAFMEFQGYKVLVIAADIRQLENIEYTPAPDIIHEAAGHAPIIANPDYAEYLRRLGEIGAKAILSAYDIELYEAVRKLSILKEAAGTEPEEISAAERAVETLQNESVELSEMAQIRNLQWWTVEYGLIGTVEEPKIYGAGLLSSIGESRWCMQDQVPKIPYSIDTAKQAFDITQPQPQLFVTPDFAYLMEVLEEFANTLSVRQGGYKGLRRLIESGMVGTIELSTGLQISGQFDRMILSDENEVIFFQTKGPTALAYREKELIGHGTMQHPNGFCSPIGKLKGINLAIENMGPIDLKAYNFYDGKRLSFAYESGIQVEGLNVTGIRSVQGKLMLIQLIDCTVTYQDEILFRPEQGPFDMAVGREVVAAFAGAADYHSFPHLYHKSTTASIKPQKSSKRLQLENLYGKIRAVRESEAPLHASLLADLFARLSKEHAGDWLLALEILELAKEEELKAAIHAYFEELIRQKPSVAHLIQDGIDLL